MDRSTTHFQLANIMYIYAINKISLNEKCVCFITCLIRMHVFFFFVFFFRIRVSTLNVFKYML